MITNLQNRLETRRHDGELDRADLVQTILLVAGFAIIAILVVTWLGTAILNKGADAATCIEGSNTYGGSLNESQEACDTKHSDDNSFKQGEGYSSRYGS
jgi:hypothetical protein